MSRYVIERSLPGAGDLSPEQLHEVSASSNAVLAGMSGITWVESYVTADKLFCMYEADNPQLIEEHARAGGFPCDTINEVTSVINPATGR